MKLASSAVPIEVDRQPSRLLARAVLSPSVAAPPSTRYCVRVGSAEKLPVLVCLLLLATRWASAVTRLPPPAVRAVSSSAVPAAVASLAPSAAVAAKPPGGPLSVGEVHPRRVLARARA